MYTNKASSKYIECDEKRISEEKSKIFAYLMYEKRLFDFYLLTPLPIIVEHRIDYQNGKIYPLSELLNSRILSYVNEEGVDEQLNTVCNDVLI